jgi:hypothetical protein
MGNKVFLVKRTRNGKCCSQEDFRSKNCTVVLKQGLSERDSGWLHVLPLFMIVAAVPDFVVVAHLLVRAIHSQEINVTRQNAPAMLWHAVELALPLKLFFH